jgi:hypothetical protein
MSDSNPYRPPQAAVADRDRPRGSPVKGMVFGVLVDIGGTILAGMTLVFVWAIWLAANGHSGEQIEQALQNPDPASAVSILGYVVGTAFSGLGGYVCARVARETELRCAAVVAAVSLAFGFAVGGTHSLETNILLTAATIAAVLSGAWFGKRRNQGQPT